MKRTNVENLRQRMKINMEKDIIPLADLAKTLILANDIPSLHAQMHLLILI